MTNYSRGGAIVRSMADPAFLRRINFEDVIMARALRMLFLGPRDMVVSNLIHSSRKVPTPKNNSP